ncbi:metabolite traffic protein EboE [Pontibacter sp. G13]|uniref:metabolite traffic protein EboE n=1 Tax=Pontibacter sp. G13 TaxID=3074898 RepID=UPI00288ADC61|nr:metabolite traffic protein EboE [Pontibacter sp. G13]WNJ20609.1 metabolite traffic protein EboE [Pontibacter sp. G13]
MQLDSPFQLTYCTNIHPGEHWDEVFQSLKTHTLPIKQSVAPDQPFGIGLRLSDLASREILAGDALTEFKAWLGEHDLYVFTMNGFPYGGFHHQRVKDEVHAPDWTTPERLAYTIRLFDILGELLPAGMEGGISTSPISYKYWHKTPADLEAATEKGIQHMLEVARHLHHWETEKGVWMHLDIEPEPDGILENTQEVLDFYRDQLIPHGIAKFGEWFGYSPEESAKLIRRYLTICYDVCHFAVAYEAPSMTFAAFEQADIPIGKIQISAALKATFPQDPQQRAPWAQAFGAFNESTYLHQVIARTQSGDLVQYPDLPQALDQILLPEVAEWRTHFHVPIFLEDYHLLQPTQDAIIATLEAIQQRPNCRHLEVETYTWDVLPKDMQTDLTSSISRELEWVLNQFA